jgi:hypothetical protein
MMIYDKNGMVLDGQYICWGVIYGMEWMDAMGR